MDAIKFLTNQHRQIESLFAQYERSPSKGKEIFGQIERAIIPHAIIEEMYVYPMLRERVPGGDDLARHAIDEHSEVERTLKAMGSMSAVSTEFDNAMHQVIDSVRQHVDEEEREPGLLAMLRSSLTQRQLAELGRTLELAWRTAPTRAHPLAPDHPPLNKIVGLPTAVIDRTRDMLSGRAQRAERRERAVTRKRRTTARSKTRASRTASGRSATRTARGRAAAKRAASRRRPASGKRQAARRQTRSRTTRARRR